MTRSQHTLAKEVECSGIGIHTGVSSKVTIKPAMEDTGILFKRTDINLPDTFIPAHTAFVSDARRCTALRNNAGATIQTIEHLMAALRASGVDNAIVEVNAPELPILDGSAASWHTVLQEAGTVAQDKPQKLLKILKPVRVQEGDRWLQIEPANTFSANASIEYSHPAIGKQQFEWDEQRDSFDEISYAKTFGFKHEIEQLHAAGLGKGGTLQNTIILDDERVINPEALHYSRDEFARHKILDIVGDTALCGMPILGRVTGHAPGHQMTHKLMNELFKQKDAWEITNQGARLFTSSKDKSPFHYCPV